MQLSYIMQGVKRWGHWERSVYHVRSLTGTTRHQQVLPKSLSRESSIEARSVTITHSLAPFCSGARAEPDKTCDYSGSDFPIGEITFPGQWRRADNISNDVSLIQNCHSRDIVQCDRSGGKRTCEMRFRKQKRIRSKFKSPNI